MTFLQKNTPPNKPLIYVCSPYKGNISRNEHNARRYCRFVYERGGIPYAPHLLFTQFLRDDILSERAAGMEMGLAMLDLCDELWAFGNPSSGMVCEIEYALENGKAIRYFNAASCTEIIRRCL